MISLYLPPISTTYLNNRMHKHTIIIVSEKNITLEDKARRLQDELGDMQSLLDMNVRGSPRAFRTAVAFGDAASDLAVDGVGEFFRS